LDILSR